MWCQKLVMISAATFGCMGAFQSTMAIGDTLPDIVRAPVEKVYIPLGFDDNDNVEVVIHGHFPSSCYKIGPTSSRIDYNTRTIYIDAKAYLYRDGVCAQMLVPFTETINIGLVKEGTYDVQLEDRSSFVGSILEIKAATSSNPDDYLYAPVDSVRLNGTVGSETSVQVEGRYPHMFIGCMIIRDLKVQKARGNVIVVQPIAELTDGAECEPQTLTKKFVVTKPLGFAVERTEYLLHSRATSGHSINKLVDIE